MKELNLNEVEQVSGCGDVANGLATGAMGMAGGWAAGRIAGLAFGMAWGGPAGMVIGGLITIGFTLATSGTSGGSGTGRYRSGVLDQVKAN